jgi:hypothetical protein
MAAQGGGDFEELEIARAVVYLANAGGAKFEAPEGTGPRQLPANRPPPPANESLRVARDRPARQAYQRPAQRQHRSVACGLLTYPKRPGKISRCTASAVPRARCSTASAAHSMSMVCTRPKPGRSPGKHARLVKQAALHVAGLPVWSCD